MAVSTFIGTLVGKNDELTRFRHGGIHARWHENHAGTQACCHIDHVGKQGHMARYLPNSIVMNQGQFKNKGLRTIVNFEK